MSDNFTTDYMFILQEMFKMFWQKSYKIGRNDPCPCGSGKKYKKCCGRIKPKRELDYYLTKIISDTNNLGNEGIKEALKDYPFEPVILAFSFIRNLFDKNEKGILDNLLVLWRVIHLDMPVDLISLLTGILMDNNDYPQAGRILNELEKDNIKGNEIDKSPDMLMNYCRYYLHIGNYSRGLHYLEKANDKYPDNKYVRESSIRYLIKEGKMIAKAFNYWYDRFDEFDYKNPDNLVKYLLNILFDFFNIPEDYDYKQLKPLIKMYIDVIKTKKRITFLKLEGRVKEAIQMVDELLTNIPEDSLLFLELLYEYNKLEAWDKLIDKGINQYFNEDPSYNFLLSKGYYFAGQIDQALNKIKKAYYSSAECNTNILMEIIGLYLLILIEEEKEEEEVIGLLTETTQDIFKGKELPDLLQDISKYLPEDGVFKIYNYLKNSEIKTLPLQEIYQLILKHLYEEMENPEAVDKIQDRLCDIESWREDNNLPRNLISNYIQLMLEKNNLSTSVFLQKLNEINDQKASTLKEAETKYDMIIKYGDPDTILEMKPDQELLPADLLNYYLFIANFKKGDLEGFVNLKIESKKVLRFVSRTNKYINKEELINFLNKLGVKKESFDLLEELLRKENKIFFQEEIGENFTLPGNKY
jgi:hypothetical protein